MNKKIDVNEIKYVFFDLDGTLLTSKKTPSQETIKWLSYLRNKGIKCSIATGRPYYFAQNEIKAVQPDLPIISCNSALMFDPSKKDLISFNSINKEIVNEIFKILVDNDAVFVMYTKEQMFLYKNHLTNPESKWFSWFYANNQNFPLEDQVKISLIEDANKFNPNQFDVIKFLIIYSEIPQEKYSKIESEVKKFNIMPDGLSKGEGLKKLHNKGIIDLNHTLVFGDAENDISMFKVAKWSVAMGNAQNEVKKIATFITNSNNDDGIAYFLNQIFNEGE